MLDQTAAASASKSLFRTGSIYIGVASLQSTGAFALAPLAGRLLTPAGLGTVGVVIACGQVIRGIASGGLPASITVLYFNRRVNDLDSRSLLAACATVSALIALVLSPLMVAGSVNAFDLSRSEAIAGVAIGLAGALALHLQAWSRAMNRTALYTASTLGSGVAAQGTALSLLAAASFGLNGYLGTWAATGLLLTVLCLAWSGLKSPRRLAPGIFRSAILIGLPTILHTLSAVALSVGDRFALALLVESELVGQYHVSYVLASAGIVVASALSGAWAPHVLAREGDSARSEQLKRTSRTVAIFIAGASSAAILLAPVVIHYVAGAAYSAADLRATVGLVGLGAIPYVFYLAAQICLLGHERTVAIALGTSIAATANFGLNLALIPLWGLEGAAVATLLGYTVLAVASVIMARRIDAEFALSIDAVIGPTLALAAAALMGWRLRVDGADALLRFGLAAAFGLAGLAAAWRTSERNETS